MMAWILVSLLAGYVSDAVVAFSPDTNVGSIDMAAGGEGLPPKP
jgi:hypothetical protein